MPLPVRCASPLLSVSVRLGPFCLKISLSMPTSKEVMSACALPSNVKCYESANGEQCECTTRATVPSGWSQVSTCSQQSVASATNAECCAYSDSQDTECVCAPKCVQHAGKDCECKGTGIFEVIVGTGDTVVSSCTPPSSGGKTGLCCNSTYSDSCVCFADATKQCDVHSTPVSSCSGQPKCGDSGPLTSCANATYKQPSSGGGGGGCGL